MDPKSTGIYTGPYPSISLLWTLLGLENSDRLGVRDTFVFTSDIVSSFECSTSQLPYGVVSVSRVYVSDFLKIKKQQQKPRSSNFFRDILVIDLW